ncbi:MAG: methyltransferase domain-containing protein [Flavobacteriales bacterium]|nr:methyltransferase domain-containing protein [Flavobacteriales bacterium]
MFNSLRQRFDQWLIQAALKRMGPRQRRLMGLAGSEVECPCCGGRFLCYLPFGVAHRRRAHAQCPQCASLERHRLMWLFLQRHTTLMKEPLKLLHVSPEQFYFDRLSAHPLVDYTAGDKFEPGYEYPKGTIDLDLTRIGFPAHTFDAVICSHVLEHIPDDRLAMRELHRVLKPGGWAIIQVPLDKSMAHTDEDVTMTDPKERERRFGQHDHFRLYGRDLKDRLEESAFRVEVVPFSASYTAQERFRYGLPGDEDIYFCTA